MGDDPGLSGGARWPHKGPHQGEAGRRARIRDADVRTKAEVGKRAADDSPPALQTEERARSQGTRAACKKLARQDSRFSPRASKRNPTLPAPGLGDL